MLEALGKQCHVVYGLSTVPVRALLIFILLVSSGACSSKAHRADAGPKPQPDTIPRISVRAGKGLLFTFFNRRADMQTAEDPGAVPQTARTDVWVTDPRVRLPGDMIIVADLRKKGKTGEYRAWVEPKGTWLDRVMPKTSELKALARAALQAEQKKRNRKRRRWRRAARRRKPRQGSASPAKAQRPQVILFSTAWCPSCKSARRFFQAKGVRFVELDVEKDRQAQQQYLQIQQAYRLKPGVVPLIVVNGRVFQGFSAPQIEAALAAGPPKQQG
jgi:glutaredoxin